MSRFHPAVIVILCCLMLNQPVQAGVVDQELTAQLQTIAPDQSIAVIISLNHRADTNRFKDKNKHQRRKKMVQAMREHAGRQHPALLAFLRANGATAIKPLWIVNSIAATVPASLIPQLAKRPAVARVYRDATLSAPGAAPNSLAIPEWNLAATHTPEVWGLGHTGAGVVVANLDTGVDVLHPDLASQYRGGSNSWFDAHGQHATPVDLAGAVSGHGTQTMGLLVAGNSGGTAIGAAPGAQWIAAKIFDDQGGALESHFHQSFQWLLDPDNNPVTDDAPDVVNASFETALAGTCDTQFQTDIEALKTAGIAVVFAAGNSGPNSTTGSSPANNPGSFAVGAVDSAAVIADSSARGPAPIACGGGLFPNLVAPGVNVYSTDLSFADMASFISVSGSSFAAPQVAGAMALLIDAFPALEVTALEAALQDSATDLGAPGPDNTYGYGLLNVLAAYNLLAGGSQNPISLGDSYSLDEDGSLTVPASGVLGNDSDPFAQPLSAILETNVNHGSLVLDTDGAFVYTPSANYSGLDSFGYRADNGRQHSGVVTVVLTVNPVNDAPVAVDDGGYQVISGQNLMVAANAGVLSNDQDVEGNTLSAEVVTNPSAGTLTLNANGSFSFNASEVAAGSYSFTYRASDGMAENQLSNSATVSIEVLPPVVNTMPVAHDDLFLYRAKLQRTVNVTGALGLGVLINDVDSENNALSAQVVANSLTGGGVLDFNANGSFSYSRSSARTARFRYRASDGALSSLPESGATVTLRSDAPPKTVADSCLYDISDNNTSLPQSCQVIDVRKIKMMLAINDVDPDSVGTPPSDGVGDAVDVASTVITSAGKGVHVAASLQCGQAELGKAPGARGSLTNHCDGSVTLMLADGNVNKSLSFSYKVSDDLGAQSRARRVTLNIRP